jgi:hypothetical protein
MGQSIAEGRGDFEYRALPRGTSKTMTPGSQAAGGRCAQHPDQQSHFTCARCGSFMCDVCAVGGSETLCPACRQRTGVGAFPYHRDDFSFDRLWNFTFEAWKKQWVMLSVAVLALGGVYMVGAFVMQLFIGGGTALLGQGGRGGSPEFSGAFAGIMGVVMIGYFLLLMVLGVGFIGLLRMCSDVLLGKQADFGVLFSQFQKLGRAMGLLLMMMGSVMIPVLIFGMGVGVVVAVGTSAVAGGGDGGGALAGGLFALAMVGYLALLAAIFWITLPFTFAMLELAHTEAGAVECLKRGYSLSKGFRLQIFAYRLLGGLISTVGMMACCIGILPAISLAYMLESSLYLAVRNGSGLPALND